MRFSDREFPRFLAAGAFNTGFGYVMYLAFALVVDYRLAYTASYAIGVVLSYWINTRFVFRAPWSWRRLAAFPSVYAVQYLLGLALIWLFVAKLHLSEKIAPLLVIPLTIPVTFVFSRFVIKGRSHAAQR
jgi:putative flippase GtrA